MMDSYCFSLKIKSQFFERIKEVIYVLEIRFQFL